MSGVDRVGAKCTGAIKGQVRGSTIVFFAGYGGLFILHVGTDVDRVCWIDYPEHALGIRLLN